MVKSHHRGHQIEFINDQWCYSDTKTPTVINGVYQKRHCGYCGKHNTEDHDGCLGVLPGLMNACCGHGVNKEAYVQFLDGFVIGGEDAVKILNVLKLYNSKELVDL